MAILWGGLFDFMTTPTEDLKGFGKLIYQFSIGFYNFFGLGDYQSLFLFLAIILIMIVASLYGYILISQYSKK